MLVSVQGQLNGVSKALPPCWDKPWVARLTQKTPFPAGTSRGPSLSISQHSFPSAPVEGQSLDVVALGAPTFYSVSQRPSNTCVSSYYPRRQSSKLPWIKPGLILFVCLFLQKQRPLWTVTDQCWEVPESPKCLKFMNNRPVENCSQWCFREHTQIPRCLGGTG